MPIMRARCALAMALVLGAPATARATDFYVDPVSGSMANDGSAQKPWKTIQEVLDAGKVESQAWESLPYADGKKLVPKNPGAPVKAGDTIWLKSGYHGELTINGFYNSGMVRIAAAAGESPELSRVVVRSSANWHLLGLSVSPEYAPTYVKQTMIKLEQPAYNGPLHDVIVEGSKLASKADVSKWTMADWDTLSANGIEASGTKVTIRSNSLKNVNFGISVTATSSLIEKNTIDSFAGDGLRGLGNDTTFQYNLVKNCYDVNANHDDGFQSWSVGADGKVGTGEVKGIVLRGNVILNYEDENQPFRGTLQGIGCFDGMFVDWVVENNVIITDHWHGITLLGAKNSRIVNNTVIDRNQVTPGPPWIRIAEHKDGTPPEGCLVRNNLTTALSLASTGVVEDHNIVLKDLTPFFVNVAQNDLHLLQTAPAVDKGSADQAPTLDIEGVPRPQGAAVDVGAYEWHDGSVVVPDGGPSGGAGGSGGGAAGNVTGGASSGTGGGSTTGGASAGGAAGASGNAADGSSDDDSGCGCRTLRAKTAPATLGLGFFALLLLARRRQRR